MKSLGHTSFWFPDYIARSALDIDSAALKAQGITHLVFDLDGTLLPRGRAVPSERYQEFVRLLQQRGFQILVATNARRDLGNVEQVLDVAIVRPTGFSMKPFTSFYRRVIAKTGAQPEQAAMIGNHYVNDIIGANIAGLITILTKSADS